MEEPGVFINGAKTVDIGAKASKEYKINFYSLKPANQKVTVTFKNAESGEFIFFKINLMLSPAELQGKIEL